MNRHIRILIASCAAVLATPAAAQLVALQARPLGVAERTRLTLVEARFGRNSLSDFAETAPTNPEINARLAEVLAGLKSADGAG